MPVFIRMRMPMHKILMPVRVLMKQVSLQKKIRVGKEQLRNVIGEYIVFCP